MNRVLVVAMLGLAALCVLLALQNRDLKAKLAAAAPPAAIPKGMTTGNLTLVDSKGIVTPLVFPSERPTLVFCVGLGCGYCKDTAPEYHTIAAGAPDDAIRTVWLLLDATEPAQLLTEAEELKAPNLCFAQDARSTWLRQVNITPSAVLLARDGSVIKMWPGTLGDAEIRDMHLSLIEASAPAKNKDGPP